MKFILWLHFCPKRECNSRYIHVLLDRLWKLFHALLTYYNLWEVFMIVLLCESIFNAILDLWPSSPFELELWGAGISSHAQTTFRHFFQQASKMRSGNKDYIAGTIYSLSLVWNRWSYSTCWWSFAMVNYEDYVNLVVVPPFLFFLVRSNRIPPSDLFLHLFLLQRQNCQKTRVILSIGNV